ncbi:dTDP-fucopyranose mutase [compost metagenome]
MLKYQKYLLKAEKLSNVSFVGRLATYRYMDMHQVIKEAYDLAQKFLANKK